MTDTELTFDVVNLRGRRAVNRWERVSVGDIFERLVWSRPDKDAIIGFPGAYSDEEFSRLTYRQADRLANRVANALLGRDLPPASRVLLLCDNSVEALVTKIGIAKAGMVAMPVNPALAPEVLAYLIDRIGPRVVIVDSEHLARFRSVISAADLEIAAVIPVGEPCPAEDPSFGAFLDAAASAEPAVTIHGDDIWQLLCTSGTTSMPKAVMISHSASYFAGLSWMPSLTRGIRMEHDLRVDAFLPVIYHIGDQLFPLSAWLSGGTLVLGRRSNFADMAAAAESENITTHFGGSPQMVEAFADEMERTDRHLPQMGVVIYSWGAIDPAVYERLRKRSRADLILVGALAQTESIVGMRFSPTAWPEVYQRTAPEHNYVGLPHPLLASDIVDESHVSVLDRPGTPGEAVYRSPAVTAGYYRDAEATADAFRNGWFHSGDTCAVDEQGLRIMLDRSKDIVKTGAENVSSLRVEATLQIHPAVQRAAVIGLPHKRWGEAVTAVVILRPDAVATETDLIKHCRDRLAGFETPKAIIFVDELPQTVGGKVLKFKLREHYTNFF